LFLDKLDNWNGRRWKPNPVALEAGSDASDIGYGGTLLIPSAQPILLIADFSVEESSMSSTAREVLAIYHVLRSATQLVPGQVARASIRISVDNQGAASSVNNFRSKAPDVHSAIKKIFFLGAEFSFDVVADWRPRELMALEDALSKAPDSSDWGLRKQRYDEVYNVLAVRPALDLFASATWHQLPRFVANFYTPGCTGAQALRSDWRAWLQSGKYAWIFPLVRNLGEVVQLIDKFRTNAILVVPERVATNWWIALQKIRLKAAVKGPVLIPRSTDECKPSKRVPPGTPNPALFKLLAYKISWP
jgi:hypothetical protein